MLKDFEMKTYTHDDFTPEFFLSVVSVANDKCAFLLHGKSSVTFLFVRIILIMIT